MKKKMIAVIVMGCVVVSCMLNGCGSSTAENPQKNETVQKNSSGTVQEEPQAEKADDECSFDDCHFPRVDGSEYCSFHSKHFGRSKRPVHQEKTLTVDDIITQSMIDEIKDAYAAELLAEQEQEQQEQEQREKEQQEKKSNGSSTYKDTKGSSSSSYKKPSTSKKPSVSTPDTSWRSYDEGYDAVYDDGDYDWNRYQTDKNYADGVDDAMDDWDDEYGDDW